MNKFNKLITFAFIMTTLFIFTSCSSQNISTTTSDESDNNPSIVVTSFYQYDFVKNILGDNIDNFDTVLLNENGVDTHSFTPSTDNIIDMTTADLFIYTGGVSDYWVTDVLSTSDNSPKVTLSLMDYVNTVPVEIKEGMEETEHEHEEGESDEEHSDEELDEHIWLSLNNAVQIVTLITDEIVKLDSANATTYQQNRDNYVNELVALDNEYTNMVENASNNLIIVCDRFPFRYLVDDYGIDYYAAFEGCSSESNASFETIAFLAQKIDENNINKVIITETSNDDIANAVISASTNADAKILTLNSMQTISMKDINNGVTYLDLMSSNLDVLEQALN